MTTNSDLVDNKKPTTLSSADDTDKNKEETSSTTEPITAPEFTRSSVEALGDKHVRITDTDEKAGLELFCYTKCSPEDEGIIRQCRGVVFYGEDIVMKAFPYTIEYSHTDTKLIEENIQPVFEKCTFYDAHEGTLIRVFNFSGKWYTSTHRKLNAFRSKWASRESFGTAFKNALREEVKNNKALEQALPDGDEGLLERFHSILDPKKQYMFLVRNTEENRIVCRAPEEPTVYHVGTFVDGELVMTENVHIPYPTKHTFLNMDELCHYVKKLNPADMQGVIIFAPDNKQYKILHKEYRELFQARGNEPSIKFRFLQVLLDRKKRDMLCYLYPEMVDTFEDYKNTLYDIAVEIHSSYVRRFMRRERLQVPQNEWQVLKACHAWYNEDRANRYVNLDIVLKFLHQQLPQNLNQMIRDIRNSKKRKDDLQKNQLQRSRSNTISSANNSPAIGAASPSPMLISTEGHLPSGPILEKPAVTTNSSEPRVMSNESNTK